MIVTALLLSALSTPPVTPPWDWIREDRLKHFVTSFVASSLAASTSRAAGLDRQGSIVAGAAAGAAAGLYKEVQDARAGGPFSVGDLAWDALGIGASVVLLDLSR